MAPRFVFRSARERLFVVLTAGAACEIVWTIYLGFSLPRHYVANHWYLAWVGLDVAEIALLIASAWAAWNRRAILIAFTVALATLLCVDAWFDVTTARHGDLLESAMLAIFAELPLALGLLWIAWRASRRLIATGLGDPERRQLPVHRVPLAPSDESDI